MKPTPTQVRRVDEMTRAFRRFPELTGTRLTVGRQISAIRTRLGMTQAQLARRCGVPQPHVHLIEAGKTSPRLNTLEKVLRGLGCTLEVIARPESPLGDIVDRQARKVAESRVRQVMGTMALEQQTPDVRTAREMVKEEAEKLRRKPTSALWSE